jgi:hypothetical protein
LFLIHDISRNITINVVEENIDENNELNVEDADKESQNNTEKSVEIKSE